MHHSDIAPWIHRIDAVSAAVREHFLPLDHEILNRKPNAQTWSIAEVLEHLIKVNSSYDPILEAVRAGTYRPAWTARIPLLPRWLGRMIHNSVKPENMRKVRTFPVWEPMAGRVRTSIVDDFLGQQEVLKEWIRTSEERLQRNTIIHSPANKLIVYPLKAAFDIIVTHDERHLMQAQRILSQHNLL